ncbi:MAG: efflux RND transporter periplasmic adaptor subunit [Bacteroidia bacterium]|nr:efflux RND transporter periplasmic adaptor subunit [Bacteroidia bacterium]
MNRKFIYALVALAMAVLAYFFISNLWKDSSEEKLTAKVIKGDFEVTVFTTGELQAKNSLDIDGPTGMRNAQIWQVKIADLVSEGTRVKKGEYIGRLDQTEIMNRIKDESSEIAKNESRFIQTKLDTTLDLRNARDEIINLGFAVKEKENIVSQSTYEAPSIIQQAKMDLDKSKRQLNQAETNYKIKEKQAKAKMQEVTAVLERSQNKVKVLQDLLNDFTIVAPEDGMVIYQREWNGKKRIVGSTIGAWDPTVATLPDLSIMQSRTYVNEVDIRKIKKGQKVNISLDAYPEKKLTGLVDAVANVGEQNPRSDAKVFEVNILINEKDTSLRPAMTTGNYILADKLKNVLYIPLEALHVQGDSLNFVYKKSGTSVVKTPIKTGVTNENFVVVLSGLNEGEEVFLVKPENAEKLKLEEKK